MRRLRNLSIFLLTMAVCIVIVGAQTAGSIAGTVVDPNGSTVAGAKVVAKSSGGHEFTTTTNDEGLYTIPALPSDLYIVMASATGFKSSVIRDVRVVIAQPATVGIGLTVGEVSEIVEVTTGAEVLQTQTAAVAGTITGRQITETPSMSRNALELFTLVPGTATVGSPRSSSINGLPKSAISITIDGVDVQDNLNRTLDGFFSYVRPQLDAIEEVNVTTAVPGVESNGDGAVHVRFVTRRGSNDYRGGLFWQHRNTALNANYWYNNRDLARDPATGKAPRNRIILNQYGGKLGGPLPFPHFGEGTPLFSSGKDRAFFFVNYEEFRLPSSFTRTRTVITPAAQNGIFSYIVGGQTRSVDLFQLASSNGQLATPDPTVGAFLARIRSGVSSTGTLTPITNSPNRQNYSFLSPSMDVRKFLALRFDLNLSKAHNVEFVANRQRLAASPDLARGLDPQFPGFSGYDYTASPRSTVAALRSTLGSNIINELRFGTSGGSQLIGSLSPDDFASSRGFNLNVSSIGSTNPYPFNSGYSRIREPVYELTDSVTWLAGDHTINFGGQYKHIKTFESTLFWVVPFLSFGVDSSEGTAFSMFNATTMPGSSPQQQNEARNLYAALVGRVSVYDSGIWLDETGVFRENSPLTYQLALKTYGLYAQDQWRIRNNLTVNFGLRWQPQTGFVIRNGSAPRLENPDQIWGVSGPGNIFRPGVLEGQAPRVVLYQKGEKIYPDDLNNFAPALGVVWSPSIKGFLRPLFGGYGESVIRAGFSRAFIREGSVQQLTPIRNTSGSFLDITRSIFNGGLTPGSNLRDPNNPNLRALPFPATPAFPIPVTGQVVSVDRDIKTGYVDSFSMGYQRQFGQNTAIEVRYVGNRGHRIRRTNSVNEINTIENGFANEFRLAQANLYANLAAGRGATFAYFGAGTGTSPLPIMLAYFNPPATYDPNNPARYAAANFANVVLTNHLSRNNPNVVGFVGMPGSPGLEFNQPARRANAAANGLPVNFFRVNPAANIANLLSDDASTWYDSGVIEFRRRLSAGLRVQASYVFSKAQSNAFSSSENQRSDYTLRPGGLDLAKNVQVFDIRHAFKFDATYDLPIGRGRMFWSGANSLVNAFVGGWSIMPVIRWQSGSPFTLGNVQLVGMTRKELQDEIRVRKGPNVVTYLPEDIILNTQRAFNIDVTTATGYGNTFGGAPQGRFIAPAGFGNCVSRFAGECGFTNLILHGPSFFKFDAAVSKRFAIDEKRNVEFRATFLDLLNSPAFRVGGWVSDVTGTGVGGPTFGQLGPDSAYRDLSGTNNPGGRLIDLLLRINF